MAFSYWRTGNFGSGSYRPANQGGQGTQRNTGYEGYGYAQFAPASGKWGRDRWNKWVWGGSCLRTDLVTVTMWSPSQLASTLVGWYQGDHLGGADGSSIGPWLDDSGSVNDATVGTAPKLKAAFLNNLNVVEFVAASSQFMFLPYTLISGLTEGSVFFVTKLKTDPPGSGAVNGPVVGNTGNPAVSDLYPGTDGNVYSVFLSNTQYNCGDPGVMTNWHIGSFQSKTNDFRYAFNGVDAFTNGANTVQVAASGDAGPYIGTNAGGFLDGYIAEIIFCNSFLTTDQRQLIEGYLAWKWGLTANLDAGHPYKSVSPPVSSGPTVYNVSILASVTPVPTLIRATAKPLATSSTPAPSLVRSTSKPLRTTSTPVPSLSRSTGKLVLTATTPSPKLVRASGKNVLAVTTPVPSLTRSLARSLLTATTPSPSLSRQTGKPLKTASTPVPSLALARIYARSLLTATIPVPSLQRSTAKPLRTTVTPVPSLTRGMAKSLLTATTPVPALSRQLGKSLVVATVPVPTLSKNRVFTISLQAVVGAVSGGGGGGGPRVTAFFYRR